MSRVQLVEPSQAPIRARPYFADGKPGSLVASLAHVPELLDAAMPFLSAIFGGTAVSKRLKEIVVLRASALMQCRFCTQTHTVVALRAGLSREEVVALRSREPIDGLFEDPRERALLDWTDAVASEPGAVPDPQADALKAQFADWEIVELTLLAGATMMLARYCTALELPTSEATLRTLADQGLL